MCARKSDPSLSPLSTAAQYILLALAGQDLHGYNLSPGTLYDTLKKLMNAGLVIDAPHGSNEDDDRRFYRITPGGHRVLSAEISRLESLVAAHSRLRRPRNA